MLESVLWAAAVSSGGPGGSGGTARFAGTRRRSSRGCSGTGRIPERCFGNSGENWSAGGRRGKRESLGESRLRTLTTTGRTQGPGEAPGSQPGQRTANLHYLLLSHDRAPPRCCVRAGVPFGWISLGRDPHWQEKGTGETWADPLLFVLTLLSDSLYTCDLQTRRSTLAHRGGSIHHVH